MTIHPATAVAHARNAWLSKRADLYEECLYFVRGVCWEVPAKYATALEAREGSTMFHPYDGNPESIPLGAPVYSQRAIGDPGFGHIFIAARDAASGTRIFYSTDVLYHGQVNPVPITFFPEHWGHKILGWTGDLNGVDLHLGAAYDHGGATPPVKVSLAKVQTAAEHDPARAQGGVTPGAAASVKPVEHALASLGYLAAALAGDGSFGSSTVAAYRRWQQHLGYSGSAADGIPGETSLKALGAKFGFSVTP